MKVGIVSIYDNGNYGNRLQNYALQEILKPYADEVITIKNKATSNSKIDRLARYLNFADIPAVNLLLGKKKRACMLKFTNRYINNSTKYYYHDQSYNYPVEQCDMYCAGSDQVWNPNLKVTGPFHFLGFSDREHNFSFSASFGVEHVDDLKIRDNITAGLANFKYISVREEAGKKLIQDDLGVKREVNVLIDPTLYFSQEEWSKIEKMPRSLVKNKYVVIYFLGGLSDSRKKLITKYAVDNDCDLIDLLDTKAAIYEQIGPSEFVYLIHHASMICTDSFHASVFSFIFGKPLYIFKREGEKSNMGSRICTLVDKFGLTLVEDEKMPLCFDEPDYSEGYKTLKREKEKVDDYLKRVFNRAATEESGHETTMLYACYNRDDEIRRLSSSGGVYYLLARKTIQDGGVVFAACYDGLTVKHKKIETIAEIEQSCGAKYIPSELGDSFEMMKQNLDEGKNVLFVGQPCQCAGVKKVFKDNPHLLTVDFVCHGVPRKEAWEQYLKSIEKQGIKVHSVNMRDKSSGWKNYNWEIKTEDGRTIIQPRKENLYMKGFLNNLYLRSACYSCQFKGIDRITDITLGDYWGIETAHPEMFDDKGVSLVMVHSEKGRKILEAVKTWLCITETTVSKATRANPSIIISPLKTKASDVFRKRMEQGDDFCETVKELTKPNKARDFIIKVDRHIKRRKL